MLKENRLNTILSLSRQAFGKYKYQIIILTILGFVSGILEGIGVNALIPLFSFAVGDGAGGTDIISLFIQDLFSKFDISFTVSYLLIFISILFISKALLTVFLFYIKAKITTDYEEKTRSSLFKHILSANWPYLIKQKLGHLETVLMIDVPASKSLLDQISQTIMVATSLAIYILVAINISLPITLITLVVGAIIFLIFKPLIYRVKMLSYEQIVINKETAHHVSQNILGLKTVKSMMIGDKMTRLASQFFKSLKRLAIKASLIKSLTSSFIVPISVIFISAIFAFSYKSSDFNFAVLIAVVYLIQKIFVYFQQVQKNLQTLNESVPHLRSVLNYESLAKEHREINSGKQEFTFNQSLKFQNISFAYTDKQPVFKNINLTINQGEMIGLIGPSGVGKTTLVDLILRLLEPTSGEILVDNKNAKDVNLNSWRKNIGYVSQDMFLINDTIENNIRFYDSSLTSANIVQAAKMANIHKFIESTPDKFKTAIGERGIMLSAGQRQRIVIARVLARQPKLLILDEATSALDNESEVKIQEVIKKLKGKTTVLVIAHRLSTVIDCARLIVIENGRIAEQGEPQKLLADKQSYFFKTYNLRK